MNASLKTLDELILVSTIIILATAIVGILLSISANDLTKAYIIFEFVFYTIMIEALITISIFNQRIFVKLDEIKKILENFQKKNK